MKKVLICIGVILLFGLGILIGFLIPKKCPNKCIMEKECTCEKEKCLGNIVSYHIFDGGAPGTAYEVELILDTKMVWVEKIPGCSALDCDVSSSNFRTTLTNEEFEKVMIVLNKIDFSTEDKHVRLKSMLAAALYHIAADQGVFFSKEENEESFNMYYKEYDDNNDGIVTQREFGNHYLNTIVDELEELAKES